MYTAETGIPSLLWEMWEDQSLSAEDMSFMRVFNFDVSRMRSEYLAN